MSEPQQTASAPAPAAREPITHDLTSEGFAVFRGSLKVAVVGCVTDGPKEVRTKEDGTPITDAQGHVIMFPTFRKLPRSQWGIHFTTPSLNVGVLEEILATLPTGDDHAEGHRSARVAK